MTKEELHEKYGFDKDITIEEMQKRQKEGKLLNPIYHKHLPACWIIQDVWGHVENENISLGKARELTAAIIEEHLIDLLSEQQSKHEQEMKEFVEWIDKNRWVFSIDNLWYSIITMEIKCGITTTELLTKFKNR